MSINNDSMLVDLGRQVRELRIARGIDQVKLSSMSNVSLGAIKNLESGKGSSLSTLAQVAVALGREDWFNQFHVKPSVDPMAILRKSNENMPRRVSRTRKP